MEKYKANVRLLGCGSSTGVPRINGSFGSCDPDNPKNYRTRCSLALEIAGYQLIIDTAPDFRMQCLQNKITKVDSVLYTHEHADQCHGIDDLRIFYIMQDKPIATFADERTVNVLSNRFDYCFNPNPLYPPIATIERLEGDFTLIGTGQMKDNLASQPSLKQLRIPIQPIPIKHGRIMANGYRIGNLAYIPDVSDISPKQMARLEGLDIFIIDALRYRPHPTHAHLAKTLGWIKELKPKLSIITNMHIDLDYQTLENLFQELPDHPKTLAGYDGLQLDYWIDA